MSTKLIKRKVTSFSIFKLCSVILFISFVFCLSFSYINSAGAASSKSGLSAGELEEFAQNNILFYDPGECLNSTSSGLCGNTAKEIYWSALAKYTDDPIKIAGIVGNLANEGGMNPVAWEGGPNYCESAGINGSGELINGWNWYYDGSSTCTGVGAFGLTSGLSKYLHNINDNAPELIKYFQEYKEYSYNFLWHPDCSVDSSRPSYGDCLLEKIGADEFGKLVEFEVEYALGDNFKPTATQEYMDKSFSNPSDASYWWAQNWEIGEDYLNPKQARLTDAEKAYDELKDLDCSDADSGSCTKLKELRTAMWTKASQKDREDFMYTVSQEDHSIAGVEGYMNQALAYNDGNLSSWLDGQCKAFRDGISCRGSHTISDEEQDWINEALNGSNNIKFAVGNATGGSNVGAGKIVCVWDGTKCRDDVDYSKQGGTGVCSVYSPSADYGECWGLEMAESWVEDVSAQCDSGSSSSSSSGSTSSSSSSDTSSKTLSGDSITWIGDSYSENSTNKAAVETKYPGIYYNGQSGRMFANDSDRWGASGLNIVRNDIKEDLRDYLVFALGTNTDAGTKDAMTKNIDDLITTAKKYNSNTKIILVSPITNNDSARSTYDAYREAMQEAVEKYDNVYLADWYDVAEDHLNEYFDDHSTGKYTDNSTHPNAKGYEKWLETIYSALSSAAGNGCTSYEGKYPQYNQCGESWSNYSYSTDNICGSGCGAASMAMLATVATGEDIFPDDIAKLLGNQYYDSTSIATLDPIVGDHYGFDVEVVNTSGVEDAKTKMRDYLKKGYMIHFTGRGCYPGFIYASGGCTAGHVIGLFDIDNNDMVTQANSGMGEVHQKASLDDMANALNFNVFTAIKGSGNKKSCNTDGQCNNSGSGGSVSMAGLTEDQAQKVADYYNSDKVTASNFIGGFIPSDYAKVNCVSFSYWFVSAFTDAAEISPTPSLVGDGSYIADTGLPSVGWETGNDPTPYSVFGGAGSSAWSHTGVVVGKTDDGDILTIEAAYAMYDARVMTRSPSYFSEGVGILAYPGSHFTPNEGHLGNKSIKEIIGS